MEKCELRREGFRFWLRPCEEGDAVAIAEAALESREQVRVWMDWLGADYGVGDAAKWIRDASSDWEEGRGFECVIIDSVDGQFCGCCGLNHINEKDLVCNLGYWVRETKLRLGAARQAAELLREFGMEVLGMRRIEIVVADGNDASRGVAERVGALYEGIQKKRIRIGLHSHDAHMYALLAE